MGSMNYLDAAVQHRSNSAGLGITANCACQTQDFAEADALAITQDCGESPDCPPGSPDRTPAVS